MLSISADRDRVAEQCPTALIVAGVLLYALTCSTVYSTYSIAYVPLRNNYGVYLPLWLNIVVPAIVIVGLYPVVGMPIAKYRFGQPLSRRAMKQQALWTLLFLSALTTITVLVMMILAKLAHPLTAVPVVGTVVAYWGAILSSYIGWFILITMILTAILSTWGALVFWWVVQTIRS